VWTKQYLRWSIHVNRFTQANTYKRKKSSVTLSLFRGTLDTGTLQNRSDKNADQPGVVRKLVAGHSRGDSLADWLVGGG
jgi:hypothetical protein